MNFPFQLVSLKSLVAQWPKDTTGTSAVMANHGATSTKISSSSNELSDTVTAVDSGEYGWMDVGNLPYSHRAVSDSKIVSLHNYLFILGNNLHIRLALCSAQIFV